MVKSGPNTTINRVFAENFGWVGFLAVLHEISRNPRKIICCGKKVAQMSHFNLFFLDLGWVGYGLGSSSVS